MADRTVTYRLSADIGQFRAQMAQAGKAVSGAADKMTSATAEGKKFRAGLDTIGGAAGKASLVAAAGLGAVVVSAANFDEAMSHVQAATHETASNMQALRTAALQAGADTAFSATEAAGGIEALSKAGVATQDILAGGLTGALDLAAAGGIDVAEAAEAAATAMTQFGLSGEQVPHVADLLAAAAGNAQGEVSDFSQALNQSGLIAAQMGLSIEETTGTLAAFASAGLLGSDAGTSFKTALLRLANPSKEAAETMKRLGINAYDASGNLVSMSDLAGQLQTAFAGQSQAQRDAALATIFGSDAIRAANVLYSQGERGIRDWTETVNDSGFAAETAATRMDNLKGDVEKLGGSLQTALIGAGSGSQGPLRQVVQGVTAAVDAFNELPGAAQGATTALLGITAVTGGGLWFGSKVIRGIAETRGALGELGVTAAGTKAKLSGVAGVLGGPWGIALTAGTLGLTYFWQEHQKTEAAIQSVVDSLDAETGAITQDTRAWAARQLNADNVLEDAKALGLNLADVTTAAVEGGSALDGVLTSLNDIVAAGTSATGQGTFLTPTAQAAADLHDRLLDVSGTVRKGAAEWELLKEATDTATEATTAHGVALKGAESATLDAAATQEQYATTLRDALEAMREQRQEALRAAHANINYQAAIDEAEQALKDNGRTLDITTDKGRANRTALLALAEGWNELSNREKNADGARKRAIGTFVGLATQMGMTREAARRYAEQLFEIPPERQTKITANTAQAHSALRTLALQLAGLHDKTINVTTVQRFQQAHGTPGGRPLAQATGGYITGPGSATSDSIPAWLSTGEYVVRAAAVQRYGVDLFHRLNAMAYARGGLAAQPVAMAAGGRVGRAESLVALTDADVQRIAAAVREGSREGTAAGAYQGAREGGARAFREQNNAAYTSRRVGR